jgi:hypothetical protein
MITVKEKLIALADTESERQLLTLWMDGTRDELCARQYAWEDVDVRLARGAGRLRW